MFILRGLQVKNERIRKLVGLTYFVYMIYILDRMQVQIMKLKRCIDKLEKEMVGSSIALHRF